MPWFKLAKNGGLVETP